MHDFLVLYSYETEGGEAAQGRCFMSSPCEEPSRSEIGVWEDVLREKHGFTTVVVTSFQPLRDEEE